ncbi:hypothetical protein BDV37DRAFT_157970 [Aspergillus pseudonomiae]|uniref:Uncharacterized protein n=1 Tax=Aspergillus pseudonomiae TaxID=1506151 RepID=A0A5N7DQU2_9EURO|nr:uncharacterized protein BDV37DRAFT_157970 [Aspergillus pseudonomiae]KAE8408774.1 hypothetical protein BDV37DRAFT_157970 [Aspergillus pseudonomiae]
MINHSFSLHQQQPLFSTLTLWWFPYSIVVIIARLGIAIFSLQNLDINPPLFYAVHSPAALYSRIARFVKSTSTSLLFVVLRPPATKYSFAPIL